jgi:glutamate-ammonia-ligase adenylyltransferase
MKATESFAPLEKSAITEGLERAERHAPFLRGLIGRRPDIVDGLLAGDLAAVLARGREDEVEPGGVGRALRRERQALALAVAIADLAGALTLEQVVTILSDFADRALTRAIAAAITERTPGAEPLGFAGLALGKHGSRELNYSSDIDPILLFDPATLPLRAREEPVEAAVRIARRVLELLQTRDGDGYVFRVDLRLRPSPEATPLALPVEAAIGYYETNAISPLAARARMKAARSHGSAFVS